MSEKTIDQILAAFSRGHIQDALNIISLGNNFTSGGSNDSINNNESN